VANELNSTVSSYDYDAVNGKFHERQTLPTIPAGAPENIVADIHVSQSGARLYVSNRGHNSIAVYAIDVDGSLTLIAIPSCGGNWPRNFALSPSGRYMLVANQRSDEICVLPILDGNDGLGTSMACVKVTGSSSIQFV
jgi:6-phosphogluconolactonase